MQTHSVRTMHSVFPVIAAGPATFRRDAFACRIVINICTMVCSDPAATPSAALQDPTLTTNPTNAAASAVSPADADPAKQAAAVARRVSKSKHSLRSPRGLACMSLVHNHITALCRPNIDVLCSWQGALAAIEAVAHLFGAELPQKLPQLWEQATTALLERMPGQPLTSPPSADPQVESI